MKKKLELIFICGIILFGVCSCKNKENNVNNNKPTLIKELKCDVLNNVKYSFDNYFITNNNDLYILTQIETQEEITLEEQITSNIEKAKIICYNTDNI